MYVMTRGKYCVFTICLLKLKQFRTGVGMKTSKNEMQRTIQYAKDHIKRVPLDMQREDYEFLRSEAERSNSSVNGYIKEAIRIRSMIDNAPEGAGGRILEYISRIYEESEKKKAEETLKGGEK